MKWALLFLLFFCHPTQLSLAAAHPKTDPLWAYKVLGISQEASQEKITEAYEIAKNKSRGRSSLTVESAYNILKNPELRSQYDNGNAENRELNIPEAKREELAKLLSPIQPEASSLLLRTGKVSANTLHSAANFYIAMGASEAWSCFQKKDPNQCRAYLQSLEDFHGHMSLLLFMGASHATSSGVKRVFGEKTSPRTASFMGLAAGSLVSETYLEFFNSPHFKEYQKASYIENVEERKKKQEKAKQKLYEETFGNKEWYADKIPSIAGLLLASAASEVTMKTLDRAIIYANEKYRNSNFYSAGSSCETMMAALGRWGTGALGRNINGTRNKILYRSSAEIGGLLLFFAWHHPIGKYAVNPLWDFITIENDLKKNRQEAENKTFKDAKELEEYLKKQAKNWDKYRKKQMSNAEGILAAHTSGIEQFDKELKRPYLFYNWLLHGEEQTWQIIKENYYSYKTKANDKKVQNDLAKYRKSFFCGSDPENSFRDTLDIHGVPVPGLSTVKVQNFRVSKNHAKLCTENASDEDRIAALKNNNFQSELNDAYSTLQLSANQSRVEKIKLYASRTDKEISQALSGNEKENKILPTGVLPSFEAEMEDLGKIKSRINAPEQLLLIQGKIADLEQKKTAAKNLAAYVKEAFSERKPPEQDLAAMLGLNDTENEQEWQKVVRYFNSFALQ